MPRGKHYMSTITKQEFGDCLLFNLMYKDNNLSRVQVRRILTNLYNRLGGHIGKKAYEKAKHLGDIARRKEAATLHPIPDPARSVHFPEQSKLPAGKYRKVRMQI